MSIQVSSQLPLSYAYSAGSSGRVTVPVPPSMLKYSFFENVAGTPSDSAPGYSLDKLKILNTIIDRLRSVKDQPTIEKEAKGLSDEHIDALIQHYGEQLHNAVVANSNPYSVPQGITPGMLVDFAA